MIETIEALLMVYTSGGGDFSVSWISRTIAEYGNAKAMSPSATNTDQILLAGLLAGTPVMLPNISLFSVRT